MTSHNNGRLRFNRFYAVFGAQRVGLEVSPLNGEQLSKLVNNIINNADAEAVEQYKAVMKSN